MPRNAATRQQRGIVEAAIRERVELKLSEDKRQLYAKTTRGRVVLESGGKGLSPAGKLYFTGTRRWVAKTVGEPDWGNLKEQSTKDGLRRFVKHAGRKILVQDWDPVAARMRITKAGRKFYREAKVTLSVIVPVQFEDRKSGRRWDSQLAWEEATDTAREVETLRNPPGGDHQALLLYLLQNTGAYVGGELMLSNFNESEIIVWYDSSRPFLVKEMTFNAQGVVQLADWPAQAGEPSRYAFLRPGVCAAAFHSLPPGENCVAYQVSLIQKLPRERVESLVEDSWQARYASGELEEEQNPYLDDFSGKLAHWTEKGVTPTTLLDIAKQLRVGLRVLDGSDGEIVSYTPEDRDHMRRPLVATWWGGHAYFIDETSALREVAARKGRRAAGASRTETDLCASKVHLREPAVAAEREWDVWRGLDRAEAKSYMHYDIDSLKAELQEGGVVPIVVPKNVHKLRALHWGPKGARTSVYQEEGADSEIRAFCELANVPYRAQGLGSAMIQATQAMLRPVRRRIPKALRAQIEEAQDGCCAVCGEAGEELDHVEAVARGGGDGRENLRLLCQSCHELVSQEQIVGGILQAREFDALASYMNADVHRALVDESLPRAFVHVVEPKRPRGGRIVGADVNRCRRNCLYYAECEWPAYCVWDDIEETGGLPCGLEPGFYWANPPLEEGQLDLDGNLIDERPRPPLRGCAWYAAPVIRFLLDTGALEWRHVTHKCVATGRLPSDFSRPIVDRLEDLAQKSGLSPKWCVNTLWGVLSTTKRWRYEHFASTCRVDLAHACPKGFVSWSRCAGEPLCEVVTKERIRTLASHRPIADHVMGIEALYLARLARICETIPGTIPLELNTDFGLIYTHRKSKRKLEQAILAESFPSGDPVFKIVPRPEAHSLQKPHDYRPGREPFVQESREWIHFEERPGEDVLASAMEPLIERGGLISGSAGTGKSTAALRVVTEIERRGRRVIQTAPTHASARVLKGGITLHRWCHRAFHGGRVPTVKAEFLLVDEIHYCSTLLVTMLGELLLRSGTKLIVIGDTEQFASPNDTWHGRPVTQEQRENSRLLHQLAGGVRVHLTVCRRSGPDLFQVYTSLPRDPVALRAHIEELRLRFPYRGMGTWNLTVSHRMRKILNARANRACKERRDHLLFEKEERYPNSQRVYLGLDSPLVCCKTNEAIGCTNAAFFSVKSLRPLVLAGEDGAELPVSPSLFQQHFRLAHSFVYQVVQGRTAPPGATVVLWEVDHGHFTRRHAVVGLSRARSADLVAIR